MKNRPVILIVDDEKNTREGLAKALEADYEIRLADNGAKALEMLEEAPVDAMLSDVRMPGMDGLTLVQRALARQPQPVCILLTAYGTIEMAVEAMKRGAYDFLTKPVNLDRLDLLLKRALTERLRAEENRALKEKLNLSDGMEGLIGRSARMQEVFDMIRQVAPTRATVLIQGESGTGKELVARAIHRLSPRLNGPFVPVHCAALSHNLLESELFGHEKGAFTGAQGLRRGRFEMADGGTLFLDEIGEIDASVQVKILRVLEERRFERVGGQESLDVDVRMVSATNQDLKKMVAEGRFREDLFFRLYVVVIHLPALRERREDIPLLIQHFLPIFAKENGKNLEGITPDAVEALTAHDWPGNVRELRNLLERMVVLSHGPRLSVRDIPATVRNPTGVVAGGGSPVALTDAVSLGEAEHRLILRSLESTGGNRTLAANRLGISRRTLHRKLNEYGIKPIKGRKKRI